MDTVDVGIEKVGAVELSEESRDAAGAVYILHVVIRVRRDLRQAGHPPTDRIDVVEREVDLAFLCGGQDMEHCVRRSPHRHIECGGVRERCSGCDVPREHRRVVALVPAPREVNDGSTRSFEQLSASSMGGQRRSVPRQSESEGLRQTVHRVRREHA